MSEAEDTADEIEKNLAENSARELIQKRRCDCSGQQK